MSEQPKLSRTQLLDRMAAMLTETPLDLPTDTPDPGTAAPAQPQEAQSRRVESLIVLAEVMAESSRNARSWMAPGGSCCSPPNRTPEDFCANPACQARAIRYAAEWAQQAAHAGRQLLALVAVPEQQLIEQRMIGHADGQRHAIADVNAGLVDDLIQPRLQKAEADVARLSTQLEQLQVQLAGCGVAAIGNTRAALANAAKPGDYGYSASYQDVLNAVTREVDLRERVDQLTRGIVGENYEIVSRDVRPALVRLADENDAQRLQIQQLVQRLAAAEGLIAKVVAEMRTIGLVAGQCSVEGPHSVAASMAAAEAERCLKWADELSTRLAASSETV